LKTFYILYEKHDEVKIDPFKIYLLGRLGKFVDLEKPSQYDRWQIKLCLDDGIVSKVDALLQIGPFPTSLSREITVSIRTNDPALRDYEELDLKGPFPFLHECGVPGPSSIDPSTLPDRFKEGTEVMVKCLFTAYNIKGRSGYSFKLLEIFRLGTDLDDELDDGLILGDAPLFPKKRKIDKGKAREV
jgi:hypothetical protein